MSLHVLNLVELGWAWLTSWLYLQGKILTKQTVFSVGSRPQKIIKSGNGPNRSPLKTHCCSFFSVFSFISWRSRCHKSSCAITPCATSGFRYIDVAFPAQHGPLGTRGGAKIVPGTRQHHLMAKLKKSSGAESVLLEKPCNWLELFLTKTSQIKESHLHQCDRWR